MRLEVMEKQKTEQIVSNNLKEKIAKEYGVNYDKGNYSSNNIEDRNQSNANILYNNQHINENQQTFNSQMNFNQNEQVYDREESINKETRIYSTENNSVKIMFRNAKMKRD